MLSGQNWKAHCCIFICINLLFCSPYENDIKNLSSGFVDFAAVRKAAQDDLLDVMKEFAIYFIGKIIIV